MYKFEELDEITRKWMLEEFLKEEESGNPYRSIRLSKIGLNIFPFEMKNAIAEGNEITLAQALSDDKNWQPYESYQRRGISYQRRINPVKAAEFLADTEFITWYTRGFARRLLEEGEVFCQVVRVAFAMVPRDECLLHENKTFNVLNIYNGHRSRYWPPPGNKSAFSIPSGTNCHHSIRRMPID